MLYFEAHAEPSVPEQATLECSMDVPIVVPTPPINVTFPCCPGCETPNEPVMELVPIEEDHPVTLPCNNQGQGARMATVRSGQHACCGGHSDHQGYGGVSCMQPSAVPRHEYPDRCEREQSHLRQFTKFGLAREETGDDDSGSNSSHAREFWFGMGYKREGATFTMGGASYLPWLVGSLEERPGEGY